ncbi:L-carnitine dehydrogenase [Pseudomonas marincola]|uniref:L-carnitine dehydrogenase n=1 Tax=Pseudomonas marincola TaxID=437900 RepID=UPI000854637B|nr:MULTISPECIES: L-carnitine dehydrogenase [Pseudomonas]OEO27121.1 3-hydroxybutyryl-CoA dehydrogenase [Pseudomonas sp. J237]SFT64581.1 carnitine 3-dehydrogenase [Pseudomonas marincola]
MLSEIKTIALVGGGVIGSGWAARALAYGLDVVAWDPGPGAEQNMRERIASAWPALERAGLAEGASLERFRMVDTVEECVANADLIQESAPENLQLKIDLHARISAAARPDVIIGSSTSGLLPTDFYRDAVNPERCLVVHPFNPVYLLPLVELVGGEKTSAAVLEKARCIFSELGMRALHVRHEVPGFIADRLQESMWREALHMINDGVATPAEIDDAVRYGCGLRWAFMGSFMTFSLAGGKSGMRHFMQQFGPALKLPWTYLEAPELSETLLDRVVSGAEEQLAGRDIAALERYRDDCLQSIQDTIAAVKARHGIED